MVHNVQVVKTVLQLCKTVVEQGVKARYSPTALALHNSEPFQRRMHTILLSTVLLLLIPL